MAASAAPPPGADAGPDSDLVARDLDVFWHPCTQMRDHRALPPLEVARARGCRLELADGRVLLDAISSWWCKALGHGHPRLSAALRGQLEAFEHVMAAGFTHAPLVRLCERLCALANGLPPAAWGPGAPAGRVPGHFARVFLADNGSTGVEIALKLALQAQAQRGQPRRTRFAAFANGYHGETVGALSVGDLGLYGAPYAPLTFPVTKLAPLPYRGGPADPRWLDPEPEWSQLEAALAPLAGTLAAIVYEPVLQGAGGMRLYSPALLARLAAWARAHDVYLIADEIAAGMGRLGAMLATHLAAAPARLSDVLPDVLPDMAVLSKGLTGGFLPLSAVLTTDAVYRLFDADYLERKAFLHSNTYTGHALAVAVALAALDAYADEDVLGQVARNGAVLHGLMAELVARRPDLTNLRAAGMMAAVDMAGPGGQPLDPRRRTGFAVHGHALRRGALLRPLGDTVYLFPPLNTPPEDLAAMVDILADSTRAVL
jgi:adenosylmethionine-8-amino-7-oxononanoate aminotransferase